MWTVSAICKLSISIFKTIYVTLLILVLTYSIGGSLAGERYVLIFGYFFPYIDPDTFVGYLINFCYQSTFLVYAYCGLQASDLCFLFLIMHGFGQLEIIIVYLRRLDHLLKNNLPSELFQINELLDDIIEKHIKHTEYMHVHSLITMLS